MLNIRRAWLALVTPGLLLLPLFTAAQAPPKFKQGDRVELDILETSNPEKAMWKKATVTRVDTVKLSSTLSQTNYIVEVDPLPGKAPREYTVAARLAEGPPLYPGPGQTIGWLRPAGGAPPKIETDPLRVDANGSVLADRPLVDCNFKRPPARNGPPPPAALAKKLIQCLYEKPSEPGMDGAVQMDIIEITPGPSHRWNRLEDLGAGATADTVVYPFHVTWNQKTFLHIFNEVQAHKEAIFTCYVDVNYWYCGLAQRINDGEKRQIKVTK